MLFSGCLFEERVIYKMEDKTDEQIESLRSKIAILKAVLVSATRSDE